MDTAGRCEFEVQKEEIVALSSIYGNDFIFIDETSNSFEIRVRCEENDWWSLTLKLTMPTTYPQIHPPVYEIFGVCLTRDHIQRISSELDQLWTMNLGDSIVYMWVEKCREVLCELKASSPKETHQEISNGEGEASTSRENAVANNTSDVISSLTITEDLQSPIENINFIKQTFIAKESCNFDDQAPEIMSGEPVVDRKSTFQAHVAHVITEDEVKQVILKLKGNRKVGRASHNIMAYRIQGSRNDSFLQDYDDDGENEAGSRLMHLLKILDARNIVVIVSRWYGGILLGPDRFKHINNCARELIVNTHIFTQSSNKDDNLVKGKKKIKGKSKKS